MLNSSRVDYVYRSNQAGVRRPPHYAAYDVPRVRRPLAGRHHQYWIAGASAISTAITEQAKPAMRSPNTARIELPI